MEDKHLKLKIGILITGILVAITVTSYLSIKGVPKTKN